MASAGERSVGDENAIWCMNKCGVRELEVYGMPVACSVSYTNFLVSYV